MKIILLIIIFFILGFVQGEFIKIRKWLIKDKIPNLWMWHSVWGIFWVNTIALWFDIISFNQWCILFLLFLSAFPGIYLAGIKQWYDCNLKQEILYFQKQIYKSMKRGSK